MTTHTSGENSPPVLADRRSGFGVKSLVCEWSLCT
jgi:hypothetical protein